MSRFELMQHLKHYNNLKNPNNIQRIIDGCCKKRPRFQRQFVERYSDFLYAICCRYMGDRNLAQDQLQISWVKILDKIQTYDPHKAKIESWISTVAINTCLSELRRKKPNTIPINEIPTRTPKVNPAVIDTMKTNDILKLIETLPDIYREIFNLVEIDGYNHKEIAALLGINESSSRSRLARSKEMLRIKILKMNKTESWTSLA